MRIKRLNQKGFTLLEVIIVIIIIGVLASLALPRFFATVEYSRAQEGLSQLATIRRSLDRCYLWDNSYTACNTFSDLDVEDPGTLVNTHFTYTIAVGSTTFVVTATRNTRAGGSATSTISMNQDGTKAGGGAFVGIR